MTRKALCRRPGSLTRLRILFESGASPTRMSPRGKRGCIRYIGKLDMYSSR